MADIRSFFGGAAAAAKPPSAAAPAVGQKRSLGNASNASNPAGLSSEDRKLLAAAKKAKAAKATKASAAEAAWRCSSDLLAWAASDTLHAELEARTTAQLKEICEENGVPRSGAKYVLKGLLAAHAKEAQFRKEGADQGGVAAAIALQFAKPSLKFAGARALFAKIVKQSAQAKSAQERVETVQAAARGMDFHIYTAITGPNCKQYNGSRGEAGLEAHAEVAAALAQVFGAAANLGYFQRLDVAASAVGAASGASGAGASAVGAASGSSSSASASSSSSPASPAADASTAAGPDTGAAFGAFLEWVSDPLSTRCEPYGFDTYAQAMDLASVAQQQEGAWANLSPAQKAAVDAMPKGGGWH